MSLNVEQAAALVAELQEDAYDGLTREQGYALLHEPQDVPAGRAAHFLDARGLYSVFGPEAGETMMLTMSAIAGSDSPFAPILTRAIGWLNNPATGGVDLGDSATRAMIQALTGTVFSTEQAAALLALAPEITVWTPARIASAFVGVVGMPNAIEAEDFNAAWEVARG